VTWDYAKAYNTVLTYPEEMHMRRMVWRESEDEPWKTYGINRMHFGDRPAAAGLEVAKKKVAGRIWKICGQSNCRHHNARLCGQWPWWR
jgi:hypothetical protein